MENDHHERLVEFIDSQAGESFRAALAYDADSWELLRIRRTFATEELKDALPDVHQRIDDRQALVTEDDYEPLGAVEATVEIHDNGVILHLRESEHSGVIVTLDREAAYRLSTFVEQCRTILERPESDTYEASATTD